jgi:hypothetical protein
MIYFEWTRSAVANELILLGMIQASRESLPLLIRLRFPQALTPEVERAIAEQANLAVLRSWRDAALAPAKTADAFLAIVRQEP